jgi:dienelactone hydrolase
MFSMRRLALAAAFLAFASTALAEVETKEIDYKQGDTTLKGFMAYNPKLSSTRPGVLVVHEWWGHNEHARNAARKLGEAGYVAFAVDMFGEGKTTTHPEEAQKFVEAAGANPEATMARFDAALDLLKKDVHVDPERMAAIGYCFGGGIVLAAARGGRDLDAVVSFHGSLATETPAKRGAIKARVLALNGAADPMIPKEVVASFEKEMKAAGAKYQIVNYPGAKHGFTNPDADKFGIAALGYSADAEKKSWAEMLKFLKASLR